MPQAQHTFADSSSSSAGTPDEELVNKIHRLEAERRRHVKAIEDIDKVLQQVQHALTDLSMPAISTPPHPHRRYQKLELTGEESVLAFIRKRENPTTAEVNAHWHAEGRTGVANPILARLLKRGLLERENDPAVRGSRYRIKT